MVSNVKACRLAPQCERFVTDPERPFGNLFRAALLRLNRSLSRNLRLRPVIVIMCFARESRHERNAKNRRDSSFRRCRLFAPRGGGRGPHPGAAARAAQRPDRSDDRRPQWPNRQAHRRRQHRRVPQRGRRRAPRHRSAERDARAQRRRAARAPDRIPDRHSSRRHRRGERRRPHGRRRQYRGAAGGRLRARRDLPVERRLRTGPRQTEARIRRPRREATQEHRAAGARLRTVRGGDRRFGGSAAVKAVPKRRRQRPNAMGGVDRRLRRGGARGGMVRLADLASRADVGGLRVGHAEDGAAAVAGRAAVRELERRQGTGLFRRRRSPTTSPPISRICPTVSSSPATPPSPTRASRST